MAAYYNENDPYAARWLRNLIAAGHIASGDVDERSIVDVRADDLRGYRQAHFFAGIGGWSYALRLAGWPDERPVWTGSCPCQPFSAAGKGAATDDERHLWPAWASLIAECRPGTIFGEQVEAAIGWGWLDAVFSDLEAQGYACGSAILPACGVGAPHIRQRLWFVADADGGDASTEGLQRGGKHRQWAQDSRTLQLDDTDAARCGAGRSSEAGDGRDTARIKPSGLCADCDVSELADASGNGRQIRGIRENGLAGVAGQEGHSVERPRCSPWADLEWLPCTDGKARPVEPGTFPLAHGIPGRVGRLRAYGNAIIPQVAAEFIQSLMMNERYDQ
jgi:DNA (cytosine-5)-methyltransferase 1